MTMTEVGFAQLSPSDKSAAMDEIVPALRQARQDARDTCARADAEIAAGGLVKPMPSIHFSKTREPPRCCSSRSYPRSDTPARWTSRYSRCARSRRPRSRRCARSSRHRRTQPNRPGRNRFAADCPGTRGHRCRLWRCRAPVTSSRQRSGEAGAGLVGFLPVFLG